MAGTQTSPIPITVYRIINPNTVSEQSSRLLEAATQTFKAGVPVNLSAGFLQEAPTINGTSVLLAGISQEFGHNLTTAGVAKSLTYGSVQNQTSAVLIPIGAPLSDGRCQVALTTSGDQTFIAKTDSSYTTAQAQVGTLMGLTKDATSGLWFLDSTITASGSGACAMIISVVDSGVVGGRLEFQITNAYLQLFQ